jgi:glycosyltransferase involved in cell wall biosynthesis
VRPGFDFEIQIMHDVVFLKYPQFHDSSVVNFHINHFMRDLNSNDLTICVSETTRQDLIFYAPGAEETSLVIHPGVAGPPHTTNDEENVVIDERPFFLIIGTMEPRKNLRLVIDYLKENPDFAKDSLVVHIGRSGWGEEVDIQSIAGFKAFGYVSDAARWHLLRTARALIFPSLYEGFGLPLIEAAHVGTMSITSIGGSLPEVAEPTTSRFFDPTSTESFEQAMTLVSSQSSLSQMEKKSLVSHASQFTWKCFVDRFLERTASDLSQPRRPKFEL